MGPNYVRSDSSFLAHFSSGIMGGLTSIFDFGCVSEDLGLPCSGSSMVHLDGAQLSEF